MYQLSRFNKSKLHSQFSKVKIYWMIEWELLIDVLSVVFMSNFLFAEFSDY